MRNAIPRFLKFAAALLLLQLVVLVAFSPALSAQQVTVPEDVEAAAPVDPELIARLPGIRELAAALSEPSSRVDTLLTLVAVSRLAGTPLTPEADQAAALEAAFRSDRAWLDRLSRRILGSPVRSTIPDPAAWFVSQEMGRHQLVPPPSIAPLGPSYPVLVEQLLDRTDDRLAAALLPEALFLAEFSSTTIWEGLLREAAEKPVLLRVLLALQEDWFLPWQAAEPPAPMPDLHGDDLVSGAAQSLRILAEATLLPDPPDALRLKRLRFELLTVLPGLDVAQARTASHILSLATAIEGLYRQAYLGFIETLLWVTADLLDMHSRDPTADSPLPLFLAEYLPPLSSMMAKSFSEVDPRLNANMAAAFDVVQDLHSSELTPQRLVGLQQELADAVSQLTLLIPDMAFYFDQPVRQRVSEEVDICISLAATTDSQGRVMMTRRQFDQCLDSIVELATTHARSAELAGDLRGPFELEQMRRELALTPWQRLNYALGYLHEQQPGTCPAPTQPLPNPLEWSTLATLMAWFSGHLPVYFQTPENQGNVIRMREQGQNLVREISRQVDCISGSGTGINDLIRGTTVNYRRALMQLVGAIRALELEFRESRLRPGADVVLGGRVTQSTAYRTPGLTIGPCNPGRACEMTQPLEATRALVGLFPDEYLLADQTGLGNIEICYDNMQWIDRRADRVRADDPNVANYSGHLTFDLVGRYLQGESVTPIFGSNFVSPEEYNYLFAAASEEVLDDSCPSEWVGTRIVTSRSNVRAIPIVPNRLTYLAAARNKPSEIITANWSRGAEWRDWFVTGLGVTALEIGEPPNIEESLAQHMRSLYQAEQQFIYNELLSPVRTSGNGPEQSLSGLLDEVTLFKALVRTQLILFYPSLMLHSDQIRGYLEGQSGLVDDAIMRQFQDSGIAVGQIQEIGLSRLQSFQTTWSRLPEAVLRSGSVDVSTAHALARLSAVFRDFFAVPAVPAGPIAEPGIEPGTVGGAEPGTAGGTEPATEPATEPGSLGGAEPGTEPAGVDEVRPSAADE